ENEDPQRLRGADEVGSRWNVFLGLHEASFQPEQVMALELGRGDGFCDIKLLNPGFPIVKQALHPDTVPQKQLDRGGLRRRDQVSGRESGGAGGFEAVVDGKVYNLKLRRRLAVVNLYARSDLF